MNEIEKMYENAGIRKHLAYFECHRGRSSMRCCPINSDEKDEECFSCFFRDKMKEVYKYPQFTAEKQLELLRFLTKLDLYSEIVLKHTYDNKLGIEIKISDPGVTLEDEKRNTIGEAIAAVINQHWEFLTEKGKEKIKEILE